LICCLVLLFVWRPLFVRIFRQQVMVPNRCQQFCQHFETVSCRQRRMIYIFREHLIRKQKKQRACGRCGLGISRPANRFAARFDPQPTGCYYGSFTNTTARSYLS
jgi:hypothetical protein